MASSTAHDSWKQQIATLSIVCRITDGYCFIQTGGAAIRSSMLTSSGSDCISQYCFMQIPCESDRRKKTVAHDATTVFSCTTCTAN